MTEQRSDPPEHQGWITAELREEFPGLGLRWIVVDGGPRKAPRELRERLKYMSNRFGGAQALELRNQEVPHAYRVFFRQIGIDPDRTPPPIEAAVLRRLQDGGFRSRGLIEDALLIGTVETGVALEALDADRIEGRLGIRAAQAGEQLPGTGSELAEGALVISDELRPLARLFGEVGAFARVSRGTRRTAFVALQVGAISQMAVSEALWNAGEVMASA